MQNRTNSLTDRIANNYLTDVPAWNEQHYLIASHGNTVFNLIGAMHDGHTEDHA